MQLNNAQKIQSLLTALALLSIFFGVEWCAGILSHSLSLLADAEHVLLDVASLSLALITIWLSQSLSEKKLSDQPSWIFRYRNRLNVVAALINGIGLACIAVWIVREALVRLQSPTTEIDGLPMLLTALLGLGVNGLNAKYLHSCSHHDLNIKGAFFHILADLVSSVGAIIAAIAVIWLNWTWADGAISLVVAGFIAVFAAYLVIQSIKCLRGQVADITNVSCLCDQSHDLLLEPQKAEKLLFPTLAELIQTK
jgi:cobalt-zinc-cadmium efflux system protein